MANPAKQLIEAGFVLEVIEGGGLGVTPRAKLTDEWSRFIRANKPQILASLIEAANDGDLIEAPAPNPEPPSVRTPAPPPAPAKRTYPLPDRELDRLYLRHHWGCPTCIAAGKRGGTRCAVGLTLNMVATGQTLPMS